MKCRNHLTLNESDAVQMLSEWIHGLGWTNGEERERIPYRWCCNSGWAKS